MAGIVPLGYEPNGRTLVIREAEAETVRTVFRLYLQHGSVRRVKEEADRLGLTTFSGSALTRSPLTSDRRMLDELVAALEPTMTPDGTAIGVALANAAGRLKDSQAKSKVIVLVTDGLNNAGEIDPLSAAAVAQGLGLKVYTVGVGSEGEARRPVLVRHPITGRLEERDVTMRVEVDEKLLAVKI